MKKITLFLLLLAAVSCSPKEKIDADEMCDMAYSDIVSFIVSGYKCDWEDFAPEDMELSNVYCYMSEFGGFSQIDINGDGVKELLIGDDFGDGNVVFYDIYTFDSKKCQPVHLLCGGERDSFKVNNSGVIIEEGSSSAEDSFVKYYSIENAALKEVEPVDEDLRDIRLDEFLRYVGPTAYIATKEGNILGRLVKTYDDSYLVEVQDTVRIEKEGVEIRLWAAYDGKGVVYPKNTGEYPVYAVADTAQKPVGRIVYEDGFCPDVFQCLGYKKNWFKIDFEGKECFVTEADFLWDPENVF